MRSELKGSQTAPYELKGKTQSYYLTGKIAEGGSSLLYQGYWEDDKKGQHPVLIKELYPQSLAHKIKRDAKGTLWCEDDITKEALAFWKVQGQKERDINEELRQKDGKNDPHFFEAYNILETNQTLYSIIQTEAGEMLSTRIKKEEKNESEKNPQAYYLFCSEIIKRLLEALEPIHQKGYLHLDIAPDNIHLSDLKIDDNPNKRIARLIDYNSSQRQKDPYEVQRISIKEGYTPQEIKDQRNFSLKETTPLILTPASDLYAVTATYLTLLTKRHPTEIEKQSKDSLSKKAKDAFNAQSQEEKINPRVRENIKKLLYKGLRIDPEDRYQSIEKYKEALDEIITDLSQKTPWLDNHYETPIKTFMERKKELEDIHKYLTKKENKGQNLILQGMGGIGKSELIRKYTEKHRKDYTIIHHTTSKGSLEETMIQLAFQDYELWPEEKPDTTDQGLLKDQSFKTNKRDLTLQRKLGYLRETTPQTLLIIDNHNKDYVQKEEDSQSIKDEKAREGKLLKTLEALPLTLIIISRYALGNDKEKIYELERMSDQDLYKLFIKIYNQDQPNQTQSKEEESQIKDLIKETQGHTLTIDLLANLAKKIKDYGNKNLKDLLALIKNTGINNPIPVTVIHEKDQELKEQQVFDHIKALFQFDIQDLTREEKYYLVNLCLVPTQGMDLKRFLNDINREAIWGEPREISSLKKNIWIREESQKISLHPIIAEVIAEVLKPKLQEDSCEYFIKGILKDYDQHKRNWGENQDYLSIYSLIVRRITGEDERLLDIYEDLGKILRETGRYQDELRCREKILEIRKKELPLNYLGLSKSYTDVGGSNRALGRYQKAICCLAKALKIIEEKLPEEQLSLATCYANMGGIYGALSDHLKALEYEDKAMKIREKVLLPLLPGHPDLASSYCGIGVCYSALGKNQLALMYQEKALRIMEEFLSMEKGHNIALIYIAMGGTHQNLGNYENALRYLKKALKIMEKILYPEHPDLATGYDNIGLIYRDLREYEKALEYHEKALEIREKLPQNDKVLSVSYNNMGLIHGDLKGYQEALVYHKKALKFFKKTFSTTYVDLELIYENIGFAYRNLGNFQEAVKYLKKSLEIKKELPFNVIDLARGCNNVGSLYMDLGDYTEALKYNEEFLEIVKRELPLDSKLVVLGYNNVGMTHFRLGNTQKAMEYFAVIKI